MRRLRRFELACLQRTGLLAHVADRSLPLRFRYVLLEEGGGFVPALSVLACVDDAQPVARCSDRFGRRIGVGRGDCGE